MRNSHVVKRIAIWAVVVGGIGDIVLTNVFGVPVALAVVNGAGLARLPQNQVAAAYLSALHANPLLYAAAIGVGILASLLGGAIAGLMSKHDRVLNGALSAWALLCIDAFTLATHTSTEGLLQQILLMPVAPIAGAVGGAIVAQRARLQRT